MYFLLAYVLGSLSFSYIFVRIFKGEDIRKHGSCNAGGTNVYRTYGPVLGLSAALFDVLKGVLVAYLGKRYGSSTAALGVFLAAVGHDYPFYLHFRGGKGVAVSIGGLLMLSPIAVLIGGLLFLATVALTRYVSLASMLYVGIVTFYELAHALHLACRVECTHAMYLYGGAMIGIFLLVIWRHRSNILRLLHGTERKFSLRRNQ